MRAQLIARLRPYSMALPRTVFISRTFIQSSSSLLTPQEATLQSSSFRKQNIISIQNSVRFFQTESEYHTIADETLEDIQDAVEMALEDKGVPDFEINYASGVLTLAMPPHGIWVLNKQTPNRQIWWSSPISGPRRYEYEAGEWVFTRDESHSMTLAQALQEELKETHQVDLDL